MQGRRAAGRGQPGIRPRRQQQLDCFQLPGARRQGQRRLPCSGDSKRRAVLRLRTASQQPSPPQQAACYSAPECCLTTVCIATAGGMLLCA